MSFLGQSLDKQSDVGQMMPKGQMILGGIFKWTGCRRSRNCVDPRSTNVPR